MDCTDLVHSMQERGQTRFMDCTDASQHAAPMHNGFTDCTKLVHGMQGKAIIGSRTALTWFTDCSAKASAVNPRSSTLAAAYTISALDIAWHALRSTRDVSTAHRPHSTHVGI
eukprot:3314596-Rhodomonas_salina.4